MSHLTEPLVSRDGGEQVPKPWHHYSWNVRLGIAWTAVEFASRTVRGGDIVSVLLFQQTGSHAAVGYVQGVNGIMQLAGDRQVGGTGIMADGRELVATAPTAPTPRRSRAARRVPGRSPP